MHMRTAEDYPQKFGLIADFTGAPTEFLELVRADLGLFMPISLLSHTQNHYRLFEHRDPTVDELIMLDILYANAAIRSCTSRNLALISLLTDSGEIRETFSDLMQKMNVIYPKRTGPVRFDDILSAAGAYIDRIIPQTNARLPRITNADRPCAELKALAESSSFAEGYSSFNFEFAVAAEPQKIKINDGVYVLIEASDTLTDFMKKVRAENRITFKAYVIENNIIEEILKDTENGELFSPMPLPRLACCGKGSVLAICEAQTAPLLCMYASSFGLSAMQVGKRTASGGIRFICGNYSFTLRSSLLRNLTNIAQDELITAEIPYTDKKGECRIEPVTNSEGIISYNGERRDVSLSSVSCDIAGDPYECGKNSVITAAACAIANGAGRDDITLTNILRFHAKGDPSALLAYILGLYRAQTELCIRSGRDSLKISYEFDKSSALTLALSPKKTLCTGQEGSLWLVVPEESEGKHNFENIRRAFAYISELIERGLATRVCALDSGGLGAVSDIYDGSECKTAVKAGVGAFLVMTIADLMAANGIITERIGNVSGCEKSFGAQKI